MRSRNLTHFSWTRHNMETIKTGQDAVPVRVVEPHLSPAKKIKNAPGQPAECGLYHTKK